MFKVSLILAVALFSLQAYAYGDRTIEDVTTEEKGVPVNITEPRTQQIPSLRYVGLVGVGSNIQAELVDMGGAQLIVDVGSILPNGGRVTRIDLNKVVIKHRGRETTLWFSAPKFAPQNFIGGAGQGAPLTTFVPPIGQPTVGR